MYRGVGQHLKKIVWMGVILSIHLNIVIICYEHLVLILWLVGIKNVLSNPPRHFSQTLFPGIGLKELFTYDLYP